VVGGVARKAPFTPAERQRLKAWIKERRLHYEKVDVAAAPSRRSLLAGGDSFAVLQRLLGGDRRCLVVELRRPCPPDGAPSEAPSSVDAVLRLLQGSIDADVSLSTGNFTGEEVTRGLESSDGVDWLLTQCSAAHCDNGIVAQYCGVISAAMECNTAVYHLGAGGNANAASAYLAKYETKAQYNLKQDLLVIVTGAHRRIHDYPSRASDTGTPARLAKHLVQRILNTGVERSATEAAMINLGHDAEMTVDKSDVYINAWDLAVAASAQLGHRLPDEASDEDDGAAPGVRARHGLPDDTGSRSAIGARRFFPSKDAGPIWVVQSQDYAYRGVALRHLNALEFFCLYELEKRSEGRRKRSNEDGTGRPAQPRVDLLPEHPLAAFYRLRPGAARRAAGGACSGNLHTTERSASVRLVIS
jgi:hypothetical protein